MTGKITPWKLVNMPDEEFQELVGKMEKRIEAEKIMSPPRRPKGEKPATTVRFLRRQIANIQTELGICRQALRDRDTSLAQQAVFLDENQERERILTQELEDSADAYGTLLAETQTQRFRLAFLEGYYAKSTEAIPGAGPGNTAIHPDRPTSGKTGREENLAERLASESRRAIRGFEASHSAHHHRGSLGERPIAGAAHDATASELERHRR